MVACVCQSALRYAGQRLEASRGWLNSVCGRKKCKEKFWFGIDLLRKWYRMVPFLMGYGTVFHIKNAWLTLLQCKKAAKQAVFVKIKLIKLKNTEKMHIIMQIFLCFPN
ncbi:MAG: hypothetical protein FWC78_06515 [Defluviitaleaceae bacterium]|nr:hypothetical protein [Defluviitaleaceae bacterium]